MSAITLISHYDHLARAIVAKMPEIEDKPSAINSARQVGIQIESICLFAGGFANDQQVRAKMEQEARYWIDA